MIYQRSEIVCVQIHAQPRASRNQIVGAHGDRLKVRIAAPPVGGDANEELTRFFARLLRTAGSNVSIVGGATARQKTLAIRNVSLAAVTTAIERALRSAG